jgi:hypothetical protein
MTLGSSKTRRKYKMSDKIEALMVFEIIGKPAEHIVSTLSGIIENLGKEKGVKIKNKKIAEPKKLDNSELFSTFAEVEVEIESVAKMMGVMFSYMPAHIEVTKPSEMRIKNFEMCDICNDLMAKLHNYDSIAKTLMFERDNLIAQFRQLTGKISQMQGQGQAEVKSEKNEKDGEEKSGKVGKKKAKKK